MPLLIPFIWLYISFFLLSQSAGACVETCCKSRRCKAVSIRNDTATSAVCTLHGEFQMLISAPATDWGVFRKVDTEGCATS